jgi:cyclophilin family peptidyl-prolyl cis-trans isomerase/HEAT repeat protein
MPSMVRGTSHVVRGALLLVASASAPLGLSAQTGGAVDRIAPILAAEDAREFRAPLFAAALRDPDTLVRRTAIRAIGRVGDPEGIPLLADLLLRPDTAGTHAEAAFALGLLRDTSAIPILTQWLEGATAPLNSEAVTEGFTALARLGGPTVGAFFKRALNDPALVRQGDPDVIRATIAREAFRLGRGAPIAELTTLAQDRATEYWAFYSLARIRAPESGGLFLSGLSSRTPAVREASARALTMSYAGSAGLGPQSVTAALRPRLSDPDVGVRIAALRSLGSFRDSTLAGAVAPLLDDPNANVQVTAATTLAQLGGTQGLPTLRRVLETRRPWAVHREALLALARLDQTLFEEKVVAWRASADWRDRAVAAEASSRIGVAALQPYLQDSDPRVVSTALQAWAGAVRGPDAELLAAARSRLGSRDVMVRATSAEILGRAASGGDVPALVAAYHAAARDSINDGAQGALGALGAIAKGPDSASVAGFVATEPPSADPLLREWAVANWPALGERWGGGRPVPTGRTIEDYRDLARQYLVSQEDTRFPTVRIETVDRGVITLELFGPDAPLTVANFLRLVDRGYFNSLTWHRVVPHFVIQAGDPRGDGSGGPGWAIRDEINRRRYDVGVLGMALSGPDTGGSQWFITLSPQPHLDGGYTVFGRIQGTQAGAQRVTQGDQIRSISR